LNIRFKSIIVMHMYMQNFTHSSKCVYMDIKWRVPWEIFECLIFICHGWILCICSYIFEHYKHLQCYYPHVAYHFQTAQFSLIIMNSVTETSSLYYHGYCWICIYIRPYTQHTNYYYHNVITRHDFFVLFEIFHSSLTVPSMKDNFHK